MRRVTLTLMGGFALAALLYGLGLPPFRQTAAVDVLARDAGILGIFSDWPSTVTYYANCMGLK